MGQQLQEKLNRLQEIILLERDCARSLQVKQLQQLQDEKGELVKELSTATERCPQEIKPMLKKIQRENIRNARLLHTCLGNLRQMMQSCTRQLTPISYGQRGNSIQSAACGMLLNGRA